MQCLQVAANAFARIVEKKSEITRRIAGISRVRNENVTIALVLRMVLHQQFTSIPRARSPWNARLHALIFRERKKNCKGQTDFLARKVLSCQRKETKLWPEETIIVAVLMMHRCCSVQQKKCNRYRFLLHPNSWHAPKKGLFCQCEIVFLKSLASWFCCCIIFFAITRILARGNEDMIINLPRFTTDAWCCLDGMVERGRNNREKAPIKTCSR